MEFIKSKFEILLLTAMVILYSGLVVYGAVYGKNPITDFAIDNNKTFAGALLMALTGRALQRNGDSNGKATNGSGIAPDPSGSGSVPQR